jgi:predicted lipoprotein with Yx(FWY)xxD motif
VFFNREANERKPAMTKLRPLTPILLLGAAVAGGCAGDRPMAPTEMRGGMMTDWYEHRTLYTFDRDSTNPPSSACTSAYCTWQWPPFRPLPGDRPMGDLTIFKNADGSQQWAYKGKPLYFYVGDQKTGDKTGDGRNGVWHVVK